MKVLHLLGTTEDNGGILSTIRGLSEVSGSPAWQHHVWVNAAYRETRRPTLNYRRTQHGLDESDQHLKLAWQAWRSFGELRQLLQQEPFDILHAHTRGAFLTARLARRCLRRPVVFTNHAYARRTALYRRAASLPGMFTVLLTPSMAKHYGLELAPPTVRCISECCRDSFFTAARAANPAAARRTDRVSFVGIGNLVRWKKWNLVLRALLELPDELRRRVRFTLWGPTPQDADAQAFSGELAATAADPVLRECVTIAGPTDNPVAALDAADWFILPSTNEPCSVALIEALAVGLPVLASASGGNLDLIQPRRTGLLFDPDNVGSLAEQIAGVLTGNVVPATSDAIRESVRSRSATAVAVEHVRLYTDVLNAGPG